jgi:hypothetical protein
MKLFKSEKQKQSRKLPTKCPSCSQNLEITVLKCPECETEVKGEFSMSRFSGLTRDDEEFLFSFLTSRGSLKEVQERLSISYPTARARLDKLLQSLGLSEASPTEDENIEMKTINKSKVSEKKMLDLLKELEEGNKDFNDILSELGGDTK